MPKSGTDKMRGCIDLTTINPYLKYEHFKMEGLHTVQSQLAASPIHALSMPRQSACERAPSASLSCATSASNAACTSSFTGAEEAL